MWSITVTYSCWTFPQFESVDVYETRSIYEFCHFIIAYDDVWSIIEDYGAEY